MKILRRTDLGAEVIKLQKLLGIKADGIFGSITETAVKKLQSVRGLPVNGIVDFETWAALGIKKPLNERDRLFQKYGNPFIDARTFEKEWMWTWFCRDEFPELPMPKIYANRLLIPHLKIVFNELNKKNLLKEIRTYEGCWNPRYIRGYETQKILSIHTWALAIDFNAKDNPMGMTYQNAIDRNLKPFSHDFQQAWRDCGWVCGIDFRRGDGMHFQKTNV